MITFLLRGAGSGYALPGSPHWAPPVLHPGLPLHGFTVDSFCLLWLFLLANLWILGAMFLGQEADLKLLGNTVKFLFTVSVVAGFSFVLAVAFHIF